MAKAHYEIVYCPLGAQAFGGAERSITDLAAQFHARGNRVLMLVGPELARTDYPSRLKKLGIPTLEVGWTPHQSLLRNIRAAARAFRSFDARIVHLNISWLWWMWSVPLVARCLTRAKILGTMRAMPDPHELVPRRRYLGFVPGLRLWHLEELGAGFLWGRLAHRTVTINARDFPLRLVRDYRFPAERIGAIYNGIDVTVARTTPEARRRRRAEVASADDFLVCYAGRLSEEKGVHLLIEAMTGLPHNVRAVIVGEGPQRKELEALVARSGLEKRVRFIGFDPEPEAWMAAADVVAVPSTWYEAFGRVVVEAMNQQIPVVASRIGGMAELFEDGVHGRFAQAGSIDDLRRVLGEMLALAPAELAQMGERGRRLVVERYALERVEADYYAEYVRLAGRSVRGPSAADARSHVSPDLRGGVS